MERPLWTPQLHRRLAPSFRRAARELLLCLNRPTHTADGRTVVLTSDAVAVILQQAAFPVSTWAGASWLKAQTVRQPAPRPAAQPGQPQGQPPAGAGLAGMPPGAHVVQAGEDVPPFAQVGSLLGLLQLGLLCRGHVHYLRVQLGSRSCWLFPSLCCRPC